MLNRTQGMHILHSLGSIPIAAFIGFIASRQSSNLIKEFIHMKISLMLSGPFQSTTSFFLQKIRKIPIHMNIRKLMQIMYLKQKK